MKRYAINVVFALALVAGLSAGAIELDGQQAKAVSEESVMYFPWVPNGSVIQDSREDFGGNGPFHGTVTVQNLEDGRIDLFYTTTQAADYDDYTSWDAMKLDAQASVTLSADDLGVDSPGGGVAIAALIEGTTDQPARIAAVQKQASDVELDEGARTSSEHQTVSGYTGLQPHQIGQEAILPIAQVNDNWNSIIHITNFDETAVADVEVRLNPAEGSGWSVSLDEEVDPGETWSLDLLDQNSPTDWVGSATITADTDIAAVAERAKNETDMLIMNASQNPEASGGTQSAPLVFDDWNSWNTGISIANLANVDNDVVITYYDVDGDVLDDEELTVPADGMNFVYTPASLEDPSSGGVVGSAIIESEEPVVGAVDEVKYFGNDDDTGHAMSYMVELNLAEAGESLAMSLIQRGGPEDSSGDTSGIQIFNPTEDSVTAALWYIEQDGTVYDESPEIIELDEHEGHTAYTIDDSDMPVGFNGSAIIQVLAGDGGIVAASNNVNYSVEYDGSASFNLVRTSSAGPLVEGDLVAQLSLTAAPDGDNTDPTFDLEAQLEDSFGNPMLLESVSIVFELDSEAADHAGVYEIGDPPGSAEVTIETDEFGLAEARVTRDDLEEDDDWLPLDGTITATIEDTSVSDDVEVTWIDPEE